MARWVTGRGDESGLVAYSCTRTPVLSIPDKTNHRPLNRCGDIAQTSHVRKLYRHTIQK